LHQPWRATDVLDGAFLIRRQARRVLVFAPQHRPDVAGVDQIEQHGFFGYQVPTGAKTTPGLSELNGRVAAAALSYKPATFDASESIAVTVRREATSAKG
jgi:hypothetical protein